MIGGCDRHGVAVGIDFSEIKTVGAEFGILARVARNGTGEAVLGGVRTGGDAGVVDTGGVGWV